MSRVPLMLHNLFTAMKTGLRLKLSVIVSFFVYSTAIIFLASRVWIPVEDTGNYTQKRNVREVENQENRQKARNERIHISKPVKEKKILTLFTTWNTTMESGYVYNNTINILSTFLKDINVVVFIDPEEIDLYIAPEDWTALPISTTKCGGTPVLKSMFLDVYQKFDTTFYGYTNADILFDVGLIETLKVIRKSPFYKGKKQILVSGKRVDLHLDGIKEKDIRTQSDVEEMVQNGAVAYGYAEDFFITTKTYPWKFIPDLVIGRPKYDNFLVYTSRYHNVLVIDASMTILALHQMTKHRHKSKDECNERILKKAKRYSMRQIKRGNLECARFETRYNREGKINIFRRGQFTTLC